MKTSWKQKIAKIVKSEDFQAITMGLLGASAIGIVILTTIPTSGVEKNTESPVTTDTIITSVDTTVAETTPVSTSFVTTTISEATTTTAPQTTTESEDDVVITEEVIADESIDTNTINTEAPVVEEVYYEPQPEPEPQVPVEPEPSVEPEPPSQEPSTPVYSDRPYIYDCTLSEDLQNYIYEKCNDYGIDYCFIMAVMRTESNFNPYASNGSCYGLMQLNTYYNSGTADALGVSLWDPYGNALVGIHHLADLTSRYSYSDALICYNYGEWGAQSYLGGSTSYSRTVMSRYYEYLG